MGYSMLSARGDMNPELVNALASLCRSSETEHADIPTSLTKIDACNLSLIRYAGRHGQPESS
jgi:hypothetical protein